MAKFMRKSRSKVPLHTLTPQNGIKNIRIGDGNRVRDNRSFADVVRGLSKTHQTNHSLSIIYLKQFLDDDK